MDTSFISRKNLVPCGNEMLVTIQISLYSSFRRAIETYLRFVSSTVGKQSSNYSCCTLPKVKNLCLNSEQFGCIPFTFTEKKRSKFIMMPQAHLCLRMPYVFAKSEVNLSQRSASVANTLYNLKMVTLKCYYSPNTVVLSKTASLVLKIFPIHFAP